MRARYQVPPNPLEGLPEQCWVRSFVITSKEGSEAGFPPLLLSRWRKADNQDFQASVARKKRSVFRDNKHKWVASAILQ